MMKYRTTLTLLAGMFMAGAGLASCSSSDGVVLESALSGEGSVRLALQVGDQTIAQVTAVISGKNFETQTHAIDVSGESGVISIFFGSLPVGNYEIELTAGPCNGSASFEIEPNEIALVSVPLRCGPDVDEEIRGGVQITGTIEPGTARDCDHITKIVAAPSIQNGSGPVSAVEVVLNPAVEPTAIAWSTASMNGAAGTIGGQSGAIDTTVTFDCSANGTMSVIANVTKPVDGSPCTEQARVEIQCMNQGTQPPRCGDGVINQASEQCDGSAFPPNTPTGTTCSSTCTTIPPVVTGECLACAQTSCPTQYANAIGSASSPTNLADVTQLFDCVIGPNWEAGGAIPQTSCFFADPAQPLGSLLPCYCGNTPQATCLATGPANNQDACGLEVELASDCSPVTASCVTGSGSNPEVPLGDVLQLLNCERAACTLPCGFPIIEE
jgi:hypothetical protein